MKRWQESLKVALWDLRLNPVRSILSLLGIVIGIASVTIILALGAGIRDLIYEKVTSLGAFEYTVYPSYNDKTNRVGVLDLEDLELLRRQQYSEAVYAQATLYDKKVRTPSHQAQAEIKGADLLMFSPKSYQVISGRIFDELEIDHRARVCLINESLADEIFGQGGAAEAQIWVEDIPWKIAGVIKPVKSSFMSLTSRGGNIVYIPYQTLLRNYKDAKIDSIVVLADPDYSGNPAKEIETLLERGGPHWNGLFRVRDMKGFMESSAKVNNVITIVGALIAGISLFVGGIGLMNVMLTSVAERMREIGLRRALGARKSDVLFQFLIESSLLSVLGGVIGLLIGIVISLLIPPLSKIILHQDIRVRILPGFVFLAVIVAAALGALFGLYPASKASRLSPAQALRSE